jgi:hypothetical protein
MATLRTEQVEPGMELEHDVMDRNNRVLARAGKVLSEKELKLFKMWGVKTVEVLGVAEDEAVAAGVLVEPSVGPEFRTAARELFRHADLEHPLVSQLLRECMLRMSRRASNGN